MFKQDQPQSNRFDKRLGTEVNFVQGNQDDRDQSEVSHSQADSDTEFNRVGGGN